LVRCDHHMEALLFSSLQKIAVPEELPPHRSCGLYVMPWEQIAKLDGHVVVQQDPQAVAWSRLGTPNARIFSTASLSTPKL
jgi:hypothetical protein